MGNTVFKDRIQGVLGVRMCARVSQEQNGILGVPTDRMFRSLKEHP